jgi:hypothetical protein
MQPQVRDDFLGDFRLVQDSIRAGVVPSRSAKASYVWELWLAFCTTHTIALTHGSRTMKTLYRTSKYSDKGTAMDESHPAANPFELSRDPGLDKVTDTQPSQAHSHPTHPTHPPQRPYCHPSVGLHAGYRRYDMHRLVLPPTARRIYLQT